MPERTGQELERIREIRGLDDRHHFTLVCHDVSQPSQFATLDNAAFRAIKATTPGPYTFILPATKDVPRRLLHPKKLTVGVRIPEAPSFRHCSPPWESRWCRAPCCCRATSSR